MARALCLVVLCLGAAFVAPTTPRAPAVQRPQPLVPAPVVAALVGLVLGFAPAAWAGTGAARSDFQLVRPSYMQGIDAAEAAIKPGEAGSPGVRDVVWPDRLRDALAHRGGAVPKGHGSRA